MNYNQIDEKYWEIERNMIIQAKLYDMYYRQKIELAKEGKINQKDMNEAAKYKLLNGFEYVNEKGDKIVVAPQKYFTNYAWLTESQCVSMGINWDDIDSPLDVLKANEFYDKYFNRKIRIKKIEEKENKKNQFTPYKD